MTTAKTRSHAKAETKTNTGESSHREGDCPYKSSYLLSAINTLCPSPLRPSFFKQNPIFKQFWGRKSPLRGAQKFVSLRDNFDLRKRRFSKLTNPVICLKVFNRRQLCSFLVRGLIRLFENRSISIFLFFYCFFKVLTVENS